MRKALFVIEMVCPEGHRFNWRGSSTQDRPPPRQVWWCSPCGESHGMSTWNVIKWGREHQGKCTCGLNH